MRDYEKISSFFHISIEELIIKKLKDSTYDFDLNVFCNVRNDTKEADYFNKLEENLLFVQKGNDFTINEIDTFIKHHSFENKKNEYNFIDLINHIADEYINLNPTPSVNQCKIIEWREIVQHCGEDMFICAKIAREKHKVLNFDFSWCPIITSDDVRLRTILNKGVSENHNHLLGSAPIADLNWYAMHNDTKFWNLFNRKLFKTTHFPSDSFTKFKIRMIKSMIIRYYFFCKFMYPNHDKLKSKSSDSKFMHPTYNELMPETSNGQLEHSTHNELEPKSLDSKFDMIVKCIRLQSIAGIVEKIKKEALWPVRYFYEHNGTSKIYDDYTMALMGSKNVWEGERVLVYLIFKNFNSFNEKEKLLAYLYFIYRTYFYSQFIETRKTPGFLQFAKFESYKEAFLEMDPKYKDLMIASAIKSTKSSKILNLELRVAPKKSKKQTSDYIKRIIVNSLKAKCEMHNDNMWVGDKYFGDVNNLKAMNPKTFVVFHFIKEGVEENIISYETKTIYKRNHKMRQKVEKQAKVLHDFLTSQNIFSPFVLAIDAANREIGCRPEVLAQIFRYLRKTERLDFAENCRYRCLSGITYHVGEDFMDIPDGLRAIYECILFLDIHPGDRLGHAIALGVNPREYYELKKMDIYKSKQDTLDDYVWMYFALNKIGGFDDFKARIYYVIHQLIRELYEDENHRYSLSDYYDSLKLRGDNPELYKRFFEGTKKYNTIEEFFRKEYCLSEYSTYALNNHPKAATSRKNKRAVELYYKYHFNLSTRLEGDKIKHTRVDDLYISAVEALQEYAKTTYILENRLVLEVNLTSNYLIGSYRGYKYSTLSSFNRYLLDNTKTNNLQVCINTDDSGVFASSLYTEYSILLQVLTHPENSLDITQKYDTESVYDYINYLRKVSNVVSFTEVNDVKIDKLIEEKFFTII